MSESNGSNILEFNVPCPNCKEHLSIQEVPMTLNCPYCNDEITFLRNESGMIFGERAISKIGKFKMPSDSVAQKETMRKVTSVSEDKDDVGRTKHPQILSSKIRTFCPFCERIVTPIKLKQSVLKIQTNIMTLIVIGVQIFVLYLIAKIGWGEVLPILVKERIIDLELALGIAAYLPFLITAIAGGLIGRILSSSSNESYSCSICGAVNENGIWSK